MFFVLSKILFFLLLPSWWIILLLLWRWFSKNAKTKKRLGIACIIILVVFTNPYLYRSAVFAWYTKPAANLSGQTYSTGIMLGGASGYDKFNVGHFGTSADRFIQTANLYHRGIIKKIMVSGGTGKLRQDEPAEAFFLREQFIANGVNDSDIYLESRSRNTYENAVYSKKLLDSLHLQPPFILITSAMHIRRSEKVFRKAGLDIVSFPCDYRITKQKPYVEDIIVPDIALLDHWAEILKEMVGLGVYRLTGKA